MKYKRIIVKLSGEALADKSEGVILNAEYLNKVAKVIKQMHESGVEIGIVVGAGNIWRGKLADTIGIERSTADYMGMLGTMINALAIQSALENNGVVSRVMTAVETRAVAEPYIRKRAIRHLEKGRVVIFAGGTGNPFFTTDTTATLRALDVNADAIFAAKHGVDGVYDKDPNKCNDAKFLSELTFKDVIAMNLQVMDQTAIAMLVDKKVEVRVFNMKNDENFMKALNGEKIGSVIRN